MPPDPPEYGHVPGLVPIVEWIGNWPISHGERDVNDGDPRLDAPCLCGYQPYLLCPDFDFGVMGLTIAPTEDGGIEVFREDP